MITRRTTLLELAGLVSKALRTNGLDAVLSGGAAVSAYTDNEYQSADLDFVCSAGMSDLESALEPLGFVRGSKGRARYFDHPASEWFVEFPPGPVSFGSTYPAATEFAEIETRFGRLTIITPTQCVLDRLAAYVHWNDLPSLDQALLVARHHAVDQREIRHWAKVEGVGAEELAAFWEGLGA